MAFILEQFVTDKKMAQIVADGSIYFPMENYGNSSRKLSSLFVTFRFTRATADLELQFQFKLRQYDNSLNFNVISANSPAANYTIKMTATGNYILPLPIPLRATALIISPTSALPYSFDQCYVGFTSDEGIISPR